MSEMVRLVEEVKVTSNDGRELTLHFLNEEVVKAVLEKLAEAEVKPKWYNTPDKRFTVGVSFKDVQVSHNREGKVDGVIIYPVISQYFFDRDAKKRVKTTISEDKTMPRLKQAIEKFNEQFIVKNENGKTTRILAKVDLSKKQTDKEGQPYTSKHLYMFVAFDTYKMRQDLKANNIDETKEYTKDDAVAALTPVLSDFLKKDVEGKISILVDDIAKATEYKKEQSQTQKQNQYRQQNAQQQQQQQQKQEQQQQEEDNNFVDEVENEDLPDGIFNRGRDEEER